jgi:DHA1 family bicyclomycin/chloramphenicol resistance-like MFS transporter
MDHMAHIAGTASAVQGVIGTLGGAAIGFAIGQAFDGTATPFLIGTAACAAGALLLIVLTEPRRLFAKKGTGASEPAPTPCVPEDLG